MKTIEEMLRSLARTDVSEFAIVSDRLPCMKVSGQFQPVDDSAPNTDLILQMLVGVGGSRYVDSLGPKPVQWTTRLEGVGIIAVTAMMRENTVQARFQVHKREEQRMQQTAPSAFQPAAVGALRGTAPSPVPVRSMTPASPAPVGRTPLDDRGVTATSASDLELDVRPQARGVERAASHSSAPPAAAAKIAAELEFDLEAERPPPDSRRMTERREVPVGKLEASLAERSEPPRAAPVRRMSPMHTEAPVTRELGGRFAQGMSELLAAARGSNASDLHVISMRPPLLRIAGELVPRGDVVDAAFMERVVHAMVPPRLAPQLETEGSCDFAVATDSGRARFNVTKQRTGFKVCVRLVPPQVPTLASLGLPEQIGQATHHHQGLILVTGPTGHGKTSTLAAIVDIINSETTHHVITVEDPVEYVHPRKRAMMSQREVGTHTKSFFTALKGSLREDPDVIVVGELRDTETVRMALSASETGHLVIGTMNTPSAAKTIDRLIDLFPPGDQAQVRMTLAGGLRLIVSQRLIPNADRTGLVAAAEILPGSISLWNLIRENKTYQIPSLQQRGKALGIVRLDDSLAELVKSGRTTLDIAKSFADNPDELEVVVSGKRGGQAQAQVRTAEPSKPSSEKDAKGGLLGKAGSLFRKGQ